MYILIRCVTTRKCIKYLQDRAITEECQPTSPSNVPFGEWKRQTSLRWNWSHWWKPVFLNRLFNARRPVKIFAGITGLIVTFLINSISASGQTNIYTVSIHLHFCYKVKGENTDKMKSRGKGELERKGHQLSLYISKLYRHIWTRFCVAACRIELLITGSRNHQEKEWIIYFLFQKPYSLDTEFWAIF